MPEVEYTTTVNLPPSEIWEFVKDMNNWAPFLTGYQQHEIHRAAYAHQRAVEAGQRRIVGVNCYTVEEDGQPPLLKVDDLLAGRRTQELAAWRAQRDGRRCKQALDALVARAGDPASNLMPAILQAVEAGATVGEVCARLEGVFGRYEPSSPF